MSTHKTIFQDVLDIEYQVKKCVKDVAKKTYRDVVEWSPDVSWSKGGFSVGPYIASHRIKLDGVVDTSFHPFENTSDWKSKASIPGAKRIAIQQAAGITVLDIQLGKDVIISNSIPYVEDVEFLGWKKTSPYMVYGLAFSGGNAYAEHRVKQV